jgi:hypothetical protein
LLGYGNAWHIWKKNTKWKYITRTNGDWSCNIILKENIPVILVDCGCVYSDEQKGTYGSYKYNQELKKWEIVSTYIDLTDEKGELVKSELSPYVSPTDDPNFTFILIKGANNFVSIIASKNKNESGPQGIWKKERETWRQLFRVKTAFECETVFRENIPHDLIGDSCLSYDTKEW